MLWSKLPLSFKDVFTIGKLMMPSGPRNDPQFHRNRSRIKRFEKINPNFGQRDYYCFRYPCIYMGERC